MRSVSARARACIEEERGLSELVFLCLGLPLDKTYQISDWERRPLSEEQLVYAGKCISCSVDIRVVFGSVLVISLTNNTGTTDNPVNQSKLELNQCRENGARFLNQSKCNKTKPKQKA